MSRDVLTSHLILNSCQGIGPVNFRKIYEREDLSLCELIQLPNQQLQQLGFNAEQTSALKNPDQELIQKVLDWLDSSDTHHLITLEDTQYPELLKQTHDAPPILYAIGDVDLLNTPQIAIVGSRNCTPGGAKTAHEFAHYLAQSGLTICSGLAMGIDTQAHQGALDAHGKTIAVIGTGIDRIYPSRNKQLAYDIAERGLIVSEFPLGTPPNNSNFPKRNRIISGLSLATLVIEATRKSGSLITARCSSDLGREVFAIPGSIHNPQAKGCHQLIRDGAKLVDQASDIIDDIGSLLGFVALQVDQDVPSKKESQLDESYQHLLSLIGYDPVSLETLVERSGLTIEQLSSMLLILELNDQIQTAPGGLYLRC